MKTSCTIAALVLFAAACSTERGDDTATLDTAGTTTASEAGATDAGDTGAAAADDDPDRAVGGSGVPEGYTGRVDRANTNIADVKYAQRGGRWEIETGPAHILYAEKDSASGTYTAGATIEQLEAPQHPEAFGIFIGGQDLDSPEQTYTYFLVRGGGEYLIKVRDGASTRDVTKWQANKAIPKADASGKASYELAAHVGADSVTFLVNGERIAAVAKSTVPTDGVAGLRINHNLHVAATPIAISKS